MVRLPTRVEDGHPALGPFVPDSRIGFVEAFDLIWRALYGVDWPRRDSPFGELPSPSTRAAHFPEMARAMAESPALIDDADEVGEPATTGDPLASLRRIYSNGGTWFGRPVFYWETLAPESDEYRELFERDVRIYLAVRNRLYEGRLVVTLYDDKAKTERSISPDYWGASGIAIPCDLITFREGETTIVGRAWLPRQDIQALIIELQASRGGTPANTDGKSVKRAWGSKVALRDFTHKYVVDEKGAGRPPTMVGLERAARNAGKRFPRKALREAFNEAGCVGRRGAPKIRQN